MVGPKPFLVLDDDHSAGIPCDYAGTGGAVNTVMALVLGAILTAFYQWRRDLVSNMFGHFLVDFVANVLPAIFA